MIIPLCSGTQRTEPKLFQNDSFCETSSNENEFDLNEMSMEVKEPLMNAFVQRLILTQREKERQKWTIDSTQPDYSY